MVFAFPFEAPRSGYFWGCEPCELSAFCSGPASCPPDVATVVAAL